MPQITSHEPGTPSWVELNSPDVGASRAFYRALFGWDSYTLVDAVTGEYEIFTLGGSEVAGLTPLADDSLSSTWTCYFTVDDVAETAAAIREAGGQVFVDGLALGRMGRMALAVDTEGAGFGLWEPGQLHGSTVVDEANTVCWVELACRDTEAAQDFYGHVLGWKEPAEFRGVTGDTSYLWRMAGRPVASLAHSGPGSPEDDGVPARWIPCFAVADCDACASEAVRLGAGVTAPCADTPHGRCAELADTTSAPMSIIRLPS
ncbi:VOC family protein [Actinomadura rugatobispora]|uniref:VOC family protein n=1 Tax=Actinomadura rugatobispora TaxID=1994 RepID=A0ABW1A4H0_9ACTN|nr:VOC family protein [Actinomadura rugatobispora]